MVNHVLFEKDLWTCDWIINSGLVRSDQIRQLHTKCVLHAGSYALYIFCNSNSLLAILLYYIALASLFCNCIIFCVLKK